MSDQSRPLFNQAGQPTIEQLGKVLDRYTERGRASLTHADREARGLNHNYIGTEHLLLGILDVEDSIGARVLANLGVQTEKVREAVVNIIGTGTDPVTGDIGLTPRAKKVLDLASDEARQLNHHQLGTEHILIALTREGEGVAAGILAMFEVDLDKTRIEVLGVLGTLVKGNVISCRIWPRDLEAIDLLVEAGIRNTRSDAASWLIHAGVEGNRALFESVQSTVAEIRRLRKQVQGIAQSVIVSPGRANPGGPAPTRKADLSAE